MPSNIVITKLKHKSIAIVGLGYVGLPLAVEFGKLFNTTGFDKNKNRVNEIDRHHDVTGEVSQEEIKGASKLQISSDANSLKHADIYIIAVPTPIDDENNPDLSPLIGATKLVGQYLEKGNIVIYESTVYPGVTEDICSPLLEKASKLFLNTDFYLGYSPERINPGDKEHGLKDIVKVTSGSTPEIADVVDQLYRSIITAGTHKASSIKVAEAAKIIENTQRDVNIALINELSIIFNKVEIDTKEVLEAAGTKWNFLQFRPGLVGGHCIGVDPYYLTHKAQSLGYHPKMILAGRSINDGMGRYVVSQLIKRMSEKKMRIEGANILIMGLTFKENCPDLRNTKVIDIISDLESRGINVDIYDPWSPKKDARKEYGLEIIESPKNNSYDAVIIAVAHNEFRIMGAKKIRALGKKEHLIYDLKHLFNKQDVDMRL